MTDSYQSAELNDDNSQKEVEGSCESKTSPIDTKEKGESQMTVGEVKNLLASQNFSLNDSEIGIVYGGECIMCGTRLAYIAYSHLSTQYIMFDWIERLDDMEDIRNKLTTMISYHGLLPLEIVLDCDGLTFNRNRYTTGEYVGRNMFDGDIQYCIDTLNGRETSEVSSQVQEMFYYRNL